MTVCRGLWVSLADELTSSQRASSEEAEQSDASMLQKETNKKLQTLKATPGWHHHHMTWACSGFLTVTGSDQWKTFSWYRKVLSRNLNAETACRGDVTGNVSFKHINVHNVEQGGGQTGEADSQVTHSEGEVRSQRRRVEIFKDGVLEVWKLETCRHKKRTERLTSHLTESDTGPDVLETQAWNGLTGFVVSIWDGRGS